MKKTFSLAILIALITYSIMGCSNTSKTESISTTTKEESTTTINEETTEITTETTTETTTSITYKTYNVQSIQFKVPDTWYYEEDGDARYFFPVKSNEDIILIIRYGQSDKNTPISKLESAFDSIVDGMPQSEGLSSFKINKKVSGIDGDFFIGRVDYSAVKDGQDTRNCMQLMVDMDGGYLYLFGFNSPVDAYEEYADTLYEILSSISLK